MANKTITGVNSIVQIETPFGIVPVGKMENVDISERTTIQPVKGLGQLFVDELAVTNWEGSGSGSFYNVNYKSSEAFKALDNRVATTIEEWTSYLTTRLKEQGAILQILERVQTGIDSNGIPITEFATTAIIKYITLSNSSFNIAEGQVSKRRFEFMFTDPIIYI